MKAKVDEPPRLKRMLPGKQYYQRSGSITGVIGAESAYEASAKSEQHGETASPHADSTIPTGTPLDHFRYSLPLIGRSPSTDDDGNSEGQATGVHDIEKVHRSLENVVEAEKPRRSSRQEHKACYCDLCSAEYPRAEDLVNHKVVHHSSNRRLTCEAEGCEETFAQQEDQTAHM